MSILDDLMDRLDINKNRANSIEDIEQQFLNKLDDLNSEYRHIDQKIADIENRIEKRKNEVEKHNQLAIKNVKAGNDQKAREHLEKKHKKMDEIQDLENEAELNRKLKSRLDDSRDRINELLSKIRRQI